VRGYGRMIVDGLAKSSDEVAINLAGVLAPPAKAKASHACGAIGFCDGSYPHETTPWSATRWLVIQLTV
jgi:hypothetical protein